jgi:MFS family permease
MLYRKKTKGWGIGGLLGFSLLSLGQIVSLIGSGMTCFAQSIWVYTDQGGSIVNLSMLAVLAQLPGIFISPIAGVLVDRWDRRWVMIVCNAVAALATLALRMLIVTNTFQIWHIYIIIVILSIANHFQWPAFFATIPLVVPKKNLGPANGLVQVARAIGQVGAPLMAGIAVTLFSIQGVILFDMVSYLVAFLTLLIVSIPRPPLVAAAQAIQGSFKREFISGWKYLLERPGLVRLTQLYAVSNFLMAVVSMLLMPMALNVISASEFGALASAGGVCMLVSGLAVTVWGVPKRRVLTVLGLMVVQGFAVMLGGFLPSPVLWLAASSIFYFAMPITGACSEVLWQSKVAPEFQGRVLATTWMITIAAEPLGFLVSAPLAQYIFEPLMTTNGPLADSLGRLIGTGAGRGIGLMFIVFGLLYVGVTVLSYFSSRLKNLEVELPDEIDDVPVTADAGMRTIGTVLARD